MKGSYIFIQNTESNEILRIHVKTPNITQTEFNTYRDNKLVKDLAIALLEGSRTYKRKHKISTHITNHFRDSPN